MKQIKKTKKVAKKHESGRSMIEMVGVLAVMGLITAAAFVLITSALRSQRLVRIDDDVSAIAGGVRLLYANKSDFSQINDATDMALIGYNNVKSPFNTKYTIASDTASSNQKFTVSFDADTATTCTALVTRLNGFNGGTAACADKKLTITFAKYAED